MNLIPERNENQVIDSADLIKQLNWRYAVKKFDAHRKISPSDWAVLEESLVLTPSSFGLQPWKFFVVTKQELKDQLVAASWNQKQVAEASHLVVFAYKNDLNDNDVQRYINRIADVRGVPAESLAGYQKIMSGTIQKMKAADYLNHWAARQLYIALGNFMTSAALLGIDSCPMEGIEPAKYDEILGLTSLGYKAAFVATAGFRDPKDGYSTQAKVRFKREDVIAYL